MDIEYLVNAGIPSPFRLGPLVRVVCSNWTIVICGWSHLPSATTLIIGMVFIKNYRRNSGDTLRQKETKKGTSSKMRKL